MLRSSLVVALLLGVTGCRSDNKDKIVGKWISVQMPDSVVTMTFEFRKDGTLTRTTDGFGTVRVVEGKYRLGSGKTVYLYLDREGSDRRARHKQTIKIDGDKMTIADASDPEITAYFRRAGSLKPGPSQ